MTELAFVAYKHVVKISSLEDTTCKHCDYVADHAWTDEAINHYIKKHGYELLFIGQEARDNLSWIVAYVGK